MSDQRLLLDSYLKTLKLPTMRVEYKALARKCRDRKVALWSPIDIQKVLPTGDRRYIEEQTQYMLEVFKGFLIVKNYPDLHGIGVECEWDDWAYNTILRICGK